MGRTKISPAGFLIDAVIASDAIEPESKLFSREVEVLCMEIAWHHGRGTSPRTLQHRRYPSAGSCILNVLRQSSIAL